MLQRTTALESFSSTLIQHNELSRGPEGGFIPAPFQFGSDVLFVLAIKNKTAV
jgi:hypothetical protein